MIVEKSKENAEKKQNNTHIYRNKVDCEKIIDNTNEVKNKSVEKKINDENVLNKINNVYDLRKLSIDEKKQLAGELREFLVDIVSKNGGHLASNLGVVELTIGLHSVFNTPEDKIIWDVGHQTYIHKILTGRKDEMFSIRKLGGISGFPKTSESEFDCFNTGHSSTSISVALGMARARDVMKNQNKIIAVIGDGALTGGMAEEALNDAGASGSNIIVILNDNEMSISKNVGGIAILLAKMRAKKSYAKANKIVKNRANKIPKYGKKFISLVSRIKGSIKQFFIPRMFFEDIGYTYLGPVDGNNIEEVESILEQSKKCEGPVLVHVVTKKGKGYKFAEENPSRFHGASPFDIDTGEPKKSKSNDYSKIFGDKIFEMAKKNEKIVAITAAMADGTGLSQFRIEFPDRFFDVGIAEQHAIGMAAGMAQSGLIPIVPIYSSFYQRAYDQVIHDVCLQNLHVVMCADRAGLVGNDGETHQGLFDMSAFSLVPNLTIMAPKDFEELEQMLELAVNHDGPVLIRYPRGGEGNYKFKSHPEIKIGRAEIIDKIEVANMTESVDKIEFISKDDNFNIQSQKEDYRQQKLDKEQENDIDQNVVIIAIGKMVSRAVEVSKLLLDNEVNSIVVNARFIKPFDNESVLEQIKKCKNVITIEDGLLRGGLATSVNELVAKNKLSDINILNFGFDDKFVKHGTVDELEKLNGLDAESIVKKYEKITNSNS